ncbi:MAG: hypothetical protein KJ062_09390 [Thermoanaerobaculia bacterium]|nr:hypothetical protein [Thermoanaerobaculia bacterium]
MAEDRKFGFVVGGVLVLVGVALAAAGSRRAGPVIAAAGGLLVLLGAAAPAALAPVHRAWLAIARVLGRVNTVVFLSLVFFLVLTPLGLLLRLAGRDELDRRRRGVSTWVPYPARNADPRHFEKMF